MKDLVFSCNSMEILLINLTYLNMWMYIIYKYIQMLKETKNKRELRLIYALRVILAILVRI